MKKNKLNVRELINKYQANCDRISEIADVCEREQRERNEAENKEFEALFRDNQLLQMKMQVATAEHLRENPNAAQEAITLIRENAKNGKKSEIIFVRDMMMVSGVNAGGIIPLNIQDILKAHHDLQSFFRKPRNTIQEFCVPTRADGLYTSRE